METLLCQFSHHRCGSTWINNIMRELCRTLGLRFAVVHRTDQLGEDPAAFIRHHRIDFLVLSNADYHLTDRLPPFKGFHVIRDPRDIVVSSYFSHRYSHPVENWPELIDHRKELAGMDKREGLLLEIQSCRKRQFADMQNWNYRDPRIMEWQMEEMTGYPFAAFSAILRFLDFTFSEHRSVGSRVRQILNRTTALAWHGRFGKRHGLIREPGGPLPDAHLSEQMLNRVLHRHRFSAKSGGRKPGETDISSHYRSGTPGDWKNHLEAIHLNTFRNRYPDLLNILGYSEQP